MRADRGDLIAGVLPSSAIYLLLSRVFGKSINLAIAISNLEIIVVCEMRAECQKSKNDFRHGFC